MTATATTLSYAAAKRAVRAAFDALCADDLALSVSVYASRVSVLLDGQRGATRERAGRAITAADAQLTGYPSEKVAALVAALTALRDLS